MSDVFRNEGLLFQDAGIAALKDAPEWSHENADNVRLMLEELLEKREPEIEAGMNERDTQYYWVSSVLRALGITFSVAEISADDDIRPDFTFFYEADDFRNAVKVRGERTFFSNALAVCRCHGWTTDLNALDEAGGPTSPAYEIDKMIRSTGVNWGVVTNGQLWRLYHRDTSGLLTTYYEVDLLSTLQNPTIEDFKYFWAIFSPEGLGGYADVDQPLVNRILN